MASTPRYRSIADALRQTIGSGSLRPGDRLPSTRRLADREGVSLATALGALRTLEADGLIVARPRSGYFVCGGASGEVAPSRPSSVPQPVTMGALAHTLFGADERVLVPLGAAVPDPGWLPVAALQQALNSAARRLGGAAQGYSIPPGRADLRRQLASRAASWGGRFGPDDLVITAGETQAMRLALKATCRAGDAVAVESPCYFGALMLFEALGLRAIEVPTHPRTGLNVDALRDLVDRHSPAAVVASPTVQNPLGATMPLGAKKDLVRLLAQRQIPLIEDDVYGDLGGEPRPSACKAFDEAGLVLYCSSASKTLAPGWRTGWIAAGRYQQAVLQARLEESLAGAPLIEAALACYLSSGDYDRHLRRLRLRMAGGIKGIADRVDEAFPKGTLLTRPHAGSLLWIELPSCIDALAVHRRALQEGIGVSPGQLFSPQSSFRHHLRLNGANEPTPRLLRAVDRVGELCLEAMD